MMKLNAKSLVTGLVAGCVLMFTVSSFAETARQYILFEPTYPIAVNGETYVSDELPILNYDGHTYIPMRAVGDILGATVEWNAELNQAEITYGFDQEEEEQLENNAFRNLAVTGTQGTYTLTGEARVFEGTMNYAVSDGHNYLLENYHTVAEGAPAWSPFTLEIVVPQNLWPVNGTLTVEVFEYSAKDGSQVNIAVLPLETFGQ